MGGAVHPFFIALLSFQNKKEKSAVEILEKTTALLVQEGNK
ncbi:hypothetical protein I139_05099 [Pasteurella multocida 2000]|nr:hypothetical protein PMCN03_1784 [Pasteurella multocida subsp. multocida str. HB03]EPC10404.1 hypothetical protein I138_05175 [Pasteurella multocida 1500E]EPE65756.1 hypothetical protein I139_05099 [Pasteurella multocida 2000]EPE66431.1 hypothetical protein I140_06880 [Pasteurella multocida 93002]EPE68074.1 hypothetical protein I141_07403 [Pasteurella multocida P1933]ESQ72470.1 hypothetical protein P1062_0202720 [Pasteurella multocida subsp. multocida P1062]